MVRSFDAPIRCFFSQQPSRAIHGSHRPLIRQKTNLCFASSHTQPCIQHMFSCKQINCDPQSNRLHSALTWIVCVPPILMRFSMRRQTRMSRTVPQCTCVRARARVESWVPLQRPPSRNRDKSRQIFHPQLFVFRPPSSTRLSLVSYRTL